MTTKATLSTCSGKYCHLCFIVMINLSDFLMLCSREQWFEIPVFLSHGKPKTSKSSASVCPFDVQCVPVFVPHCNVQIEMESCQPVKCIPILCTLLQWMLVYFLPMLHLQQTFRGYYGEVDLSLKC